MRALIITIILQGLTINCICQSVSSPIYFYGYDLTRAKVTDPKRAGQDLSRYMLELIGELNRGISMKKMNAWMKPNVVEFRNNLLVEVNREVKSDKIFFPNYNGSSLLNIDSIENIIKSYPIKEESGTGLIIFFEFFSKERKSVSGYGCLFDIKNRKVIKYSEYEFRNGNSYNTFTDYWDPAISLVNVLCTKLSAEK